MGMVSRALWFGLGYAAGMKIGDRPIRAMQTTATEARVRAEAMSQTARRVRAQISGIGRPTLDVREVREMMTAAPETVTPEATIRDAAAVMERRDIGDVLVVEGDELSGILTDRDIAVRAVARGLDASSTPVREVLSASTVAISPTSSVQEAIELMRRHDIRRLPVVESGRPIGILSLGDLAVSREPGSLLADISAGQPNN
jgi:CBS domain-containing protein